MVGPEGPVRRLRRAESFLGIHFDFHAGPDCTEVGRGVSPSMVEDVIASVRPDFIQCDCKGHPGYSSYPTRVGTPAPGFFRDALAVWRDVTARLGVALYVHYSGVWDADYVRRHPGAAAVQADGKPSERFVSLFGPYASDLLIPQLEELAADYDLDGAWVDGDSWAVEQDFCPAAMAAFRAGTGLRDIPRRPGDPGWEDYTSFTREAFRSYLRRYVDAVHARFPRFQVASNWAFSSLMPEPVSANVDFLSGDYSLQDSVNTARFEARCLQGQGLPWDLMAWAFSGKIGEGAFSIKSPLQLMQEAAVVLSLGGGFQAYFTQKRDASIAAWQMQGMAEVARFCRARQEACHRAVPVPQAALLYAGSAMYRENPLPFTNWELPCIRAMKGVLQMLLDARCVVEVCMEHSLDGRMGEYPLVVVPEWRWLDDGVRGRLAEYARAGGRLLLIGARTAELFAGELDIALAGDTDGDSRRWLAHGGTMAALITRFQRVDAGPRARTVGTHHPENDPASPGDPAAVVTPYGKGVIAAVLLDLGRQYLQGSTPCARYFLKSIVDELLPDPLVRVLGGGAVDVTAARKGGALRVNLVNTGGPHGDPDVHVFDEIPPAGPLIVEVRSQRKPLRVTMEPGGRDVSWRWDAGKVVADVGRVEVHDILSLWEER